MSQTINGKLYSHKLGIGQAFAGLFTDELGVSVGERTSSDILTEVVAEVSASADTVLELPNDTNGFMKFVTRTDSTAYSVTIIDSDANPVWSLVGQGSSVILVRCHSGYWRAF